MICSPLFEMWEYSKRVMVRVNDQVMDSPVIQKQEYIELGLLNT